MTTPATVTLDDLPYLIKRGVLAPDQYLAATTSLRNDGFWRRWAMRALLALAAGHILSGIIFFFAFNWNALSGMTKFGIVGAGILACIAAWIIAKIDSPAGQAFGIGATVMVGVMFAVLGQVYQTPAMLHTPFVFWAILTLPFALASRNLAHWTVWLVILTVAITSYANSGLRMAGEDGLANILNLSVAGGFAAGLVVLDEAISPRLKWARAEWFRLLLVFGAGGFAFLAFVESFWWSKGASLVWLAAIFFIIAVLAFLYMRKPSVPSLSLTSFALFTLVGQAGFRFFNTLTSSANDLFFVFSWFIGLTVALVAAFRHFLSREQAAPQIGEENNNKGETGLLDSAVKMEKFADAFDLNPHQLSRQLSQDRERDHPWYMSVFLGVAGMITALIGCAFVGALVGLLLRNAPEIVHGVLGTIIFVVAIIWRRKAGSLYLHHILNTIIIVGGLLAIFGYSVTIDNFDAAIAITIALSTAVLIFVRDPILEFLSAAAIITLIGVELYHLRAPMIESIILVLATCTGIIALTRPIGTRLYKAAGTALLFAPAVLGIGLVHIHRFDGIADISQFATDWVPRLTSLLILAIAAAFLNRGKSPKDYDPPLIVLGPLLLAAAIVPLGGASALLLILTGYILGSRTLALIGTLLQIYFLTMFYYDLSMDLLSKSIILFVTGLIFLALWKFISGKDGVRA